MFKKGNKENTAKHFDSTQKYLQIDQIKDDLLILSDGSLRSVLMVSGINMDLRSQEEQMSVIMAYQNALNSLDFPIQVVLQSRKVDLTSYMGILNEALKKHPPGLLREQTSEYISFLEQILVNVNIMDKRFFVVIPFYPNIVSEKSKGVMSKFGFGGGQTAKADPQKDYLYNKEQIYQRTQLVTSLMGEMGLKATKLPTEALIELFYASYNPETAGHEHIKNLASIGADYITSRENVEKEIGQ